MEVLDENVALSYSGGFKLTAAFAVVASAIISFFTGIFNGYTNPVCSR